MKYCGTYFIYFNCTQPFETALQNYVEYVYTRVSISYMLV